MSAELALIEVARWMAHSPEPLVLEALGAKRKSQKSGQPPRQQLRLNRQRARDLKRVLTTCKETAELLQPSVNTRKANHNELEEYIHVVDMMSRDFWT